MRLPRAETIRLTDREKQVAGYVVQGLSNREIANKMGVAEKTVKFYISNVLRWTGSKDRWDLIRNAFKEGQ